MGVREVIIKFTKSNLMNLQTEARMTLMVRGSVREVLTCPGVSDRTSGGVGTLLVLKEEKAAQQATTQGRGAQAEGME